MQIMLLMLTGIAVVFGDFLPGVKKDTPGTKWLYIAIFLLCFTVLFVVYADWIRPSLFAPVKDFIVDVFDLYDA